MSYKRVLTFQDISCVGQCSLTVALPILSACGLETAILPSAILSTHTAGFSGYTFRDLTDDIPGIEKHWQKEGIKFDAIYTGYLGSSTQIDYAMGMIANLLTSDGISVVDPAMADNGKLYPAFDNAFVEAMKPLCFSADIILPNITEACFLTGIEFRDKYDESYINEILDKLKKNGAKTVILTGVSYNEDTTGVVIFENGKAKYYEHRRIAKGCHGTGDVYASAFVGALLQKGNAYQAAKIAADYTVSCIEKTVDDPSHWYGVKFEKALPELIATLGK